MNLKELVVKHPYYCETSNYYSNAPHLVWETMTEFLDEYEQADIDMNLIFRWDVINRSEDEVGQDAGRYRAEVFMMHQRKGIFAPHDINHVNEVEVERFVELARKHWETLMHLWEPISRPATSCTASGS